MIETNLIKYLKLFVAIIIVSLVIVAVALWQGLDSFIFAWVLNFMLMTALLYITETFQPELNSSYYNSKNWESNGKIYRILGVKYFRKLLVIIGWEKLNKSRNPVNKNSRTLEMLEYKTRQSEFGHSVIFLIVLIINVAVIVKFGFIESLWLLVLNLLLNVYPIIVQRYNRPRIRRLIRQKGRKI